MVGDQLHISAMLQTVPKPGDRPVMVFFHIDIPDHNAAHHRFGTQRIGKQQIALNSGIGNSGVLAMSFLVSVLEIPEEAVNQQNKLGKNGEIEASAGFNGRMDTVIFA